MTIYFLLVVLTNLTDFNSFCCAITWRVKVFRFLLRNKTNPISKLRVQKKLKCLENLIWRWKVNSRGALYIYNSVCTLSRAALRSFRRRWSSRKYISRTVRLDLFLPRRVPYSRKSDSRLNFLHPVSNTGKTDAMLVFVFSTGSFTRLLRVKVFQVNGAKRSEASSIEPTPRRSRGEGRR